MAKLSKAVREICIKTTNTLFAHIIQPLLTWAGEDEDTFFFIVIGNKYMTDVAWSNTEKLSVDGACTIGNIPEAASAFLDISTGVDIMVEENVKNKEEGFGEEFQMHCPSKEDNAWHAMENFLDDDADKQVVK